MSTLGKYINTNSFLHRLDPRMKLMVMFGLIMVVLIPSDFISYSLFLILVLFGFYVSKLFFSSVKTIFKSVFFMMIFLFIFNLFLVKTGNILYEIGWFKVYSGAIFQTIFIFLRLFILLGLSTLLTLTTKPMDLTLAIESLMKPLAKLNVPVHEIAMIISIALRFIPVFALEAEKIMKAQTSRGIDFEKGSFQEKMKGIISLIVPLFVSAFQKANDLANALEARGYSTTRHRTKYRVLAYTKNDYLFLGFVVIYVVMIFVVIYAI